jgi:hypothetical protein
MLPVDEVKIDLVTMNKIGLGKSLYMEKQLEEFARRLSGQPREVTRKGSGAWRWAPKPSYHSWTLWA